MTGLFRWISLALALVTVGAVAATGPTADKEAKVVVTPAAPVGNTTNAAPTLREAQARPADTLAIDRPFAFISLANVWRFTDGQPKRIPVCWETTGSAQEKAWVKQAIAASWEAGSGIRFDWRETCPEGLQGIRIQVADQGAHTKGLGVELRGVRNGMVLNFAFGAWNQPCATQREYCIKVIAVHEFGHALAFSHEQNRPDAPGECAIQRQGSDGTLLLTPYDPDSVMNYCNATYNNDGKLSQFDRFAAQALYCAPDAALCKPTALN
ncbi:MULTISPECIES: hypothetical protein [Sphingobium]|uniref:Peptidase metallopeptidase domain-containing protein n=1 Tax=Sphingobium yanoikuyae ATCC 51230 TaxID=883163 RepID=K9CQE0_SPHYA|nr:MULTISPECIES: hypothetical protein [Sphingobium]EKU73161.1 hypothetical protein HMPREF9718_04524 [Sphingobium yanoikuyae ATCC 51230]WQE08801.1 hypothetical protein U0025_07970 [Sphingobium yanoikuyae]SHL44754.1 Astacin (Peptidase family M12A) [Sphingobium sp. YR657]